MKEPTERIREFAALARSLLEDGALKDLFFSLGSYQAEFSVEGSPHSIFSFVQIGKSRELKDFFCTCSESDSEDSCVHVAALYQLIMDDNGVPLHEAYSRSIYRAISRLLFEKNAGVPKITRRTLVPVRSSSGAKIAHITLISDDGRRYFKEVFEREEGAAEGGLWGLSLDEGEDLFLPGSELELQFEQSHWNEFGKKLFFLKRCGGGSEGCECEKSGLPRRLFLMLKDVKLEVDVAKKDLPQLVPYLPEFSEDYPVKDLAGEKLIRSVYHENSSILELIPDHDERPLSFQGKEGIHIPGWLFIKGTGFIKEEFLFDSSRIALKGAIPDTLKKYQNEIESRPKNFSISSTPKQVKYKLAFTEEWSLSISAYIFEKGDLQLPASWLLNDLAYIQGMGFVFTKERVFTKARFQISQDHVISFIHERRSWLSQIKGFELHPGAFESELDYSLTDEGNLMFRPRTKAEKGRRIKEFGPWVYVEGLGFFSKEPGVQTFSIRPDSMVTKEHIPLFIREKRDELKMIRGFFLADCPIEEVTLELKPEGNDRLMVRPQFVFGASFSGKRVRFFEDAVYVEDEGFFELPPHLRLPDEYRTEKILNKQEIASLFNDDFEKLRRFIPILDASLKKPSLLKLFITKAQIDEKRGRGWYLLQIIFGSEYGKVPLYLLWKAKKTGDRFLFTKAGMIDLEDSRFRFLNAFKASHFEKKSGAIILSALDFYRLDALEEIECSLLDSEDTKSSEEAINQLRQFKVTEKLDLSYLSSELRPYQQTGVEWLWFLYIYGLSGLLCDDMGLGKTHQAMALISSAISLTKNEAGSAPPKVLIICPASVIHHWEDKLKAFMPALNAAIYHGIERSYEAVIGSADLIITTYGVVRKDIALLSETPFLIAIFDEIQIAKNKESRINSTLKKIDAGMKVGLTGTPVENNLNELKALFDIVLPGYMPGESDFRERYIKPISKENKTEAKTALKRLIRPFVLRRKKNEVLLELPEKTEEVSHCDLSNEQVELYNGVMAGSREVLLKSLSDDSSDIPYFHIFALLTQLKRICDHPALFLKSMDDYEKHSSGKWDLFVELMTEAFESGQKVVVFSQYLGMLDIMKNYLTASNIGFAMIKGTTKNRGEEIRRFNEDEGCRVFLSSLLAGGLGIDLTAASVVIHYDRWWNAARENQATDRVHRIGQTRGVQVFKLVTKNTFEERIDEIISKKGRLADEIVASEEGVLRLFSRSELRALLDYSSTL
ncbi:DEAD/DEAH box helicase [Estrella lausannensis]|nr:DEAD/DEAH box helicase [Estrella lausannensis]